MAARRVWRRCARAPPAPGESLESVVEASGKLGGAHRLDPCCRELDGKRQPVEASAHRCDRRCVLGSEHEVRVDPFASPRGRLPMASTSSCVASRWIWGWCELGAEGVRGRVEGTAVVTTPSGGIRLSRERWRGTQRSRRLVGAGVVDVHGDTWDQRVSGSLGSSECRVVRAGSLELYRARRWIASDAPRITTAASGRVLRSAADTKSNISTSPDWPPDHWRCRMARPARSRVARRSRRRTRRGGRRP